MAIKISGNTVIDDSQNITATGSGTFGDAVTVQGNTSAESVRLLGRSSDDRTDLQFYENDGSTFIASLSAQLDSLNLFLGSSSGELKITGNQTIFRSEIGAERMRIDSSGNMGLGTESPSSLLHVSGQDATINVSAADGSLSAMTSNTSQRIAFQGGNTEIGLFKDSSGNYSYVVGTYQGSIDIPLVFRTGNRAERMRIDSSGNVKIGGTLPSTPNIILNADGSATFTSTNPVVTDQPSTGNTANPAIQIKHDGTINGSWRHDGRLEVGGQDADAEITLSPDGSATFNGETIVQGTGKFFLKRTDAGSTTCAIRDDNLRIFDNPVSYDDFKISLENDGSATFASSVECNTELRLIRGSNRVNLGGSDTHAVFENTGNFIIYWDGSASFDGTITAAGYSLANLNTLP